MTETQSEHDHRLEPADRRGFLSDQSAPTRMVAGLMIAAVGIGLLLQRFGLFETADVWSRLWPLVLVGLGLGKLLTPRPDGGRDGGAWLLIGVWLLLSELHLWRASQSWPLFLVAFGITIVWNAVTGSARQQRRLETR